MRAGARVRGARRRMWRRVRASKALALDFEKFSRSTSRRRFSVTTLCGVRDHTLILEGRGRIEGI